MNQGDIYLADTGAAVRGRVLVLSDGRFNRVTGRAIVAIEEIESLADPSPWEIAGFSLEFVTSISTDRLLQCVASLSPKDQRATRTAIRQIVG